jgi:hypothetical protein
MGSEDNWQGHDAVALRVIADEELQGNIDVGFYLR